MPQLRPVDWKAEKKKRKKKEEKQKTQNRKWMDKIEED